MNTSPIIAHGQFAGMFLLFGFALVVTVCALAIGLGLSIARPRGTLGRRVLKVAIIFAAIEFASILFLWVLSFVI